MNVRVRPAMRRSLALLSVASLTTLPVVNAEQLATSCGVGGGVQDEALSESAELNLIFERVARWVRENGGQVSDAITSAMTEHAGFHVRGVVAQRDLNKSEVLFEIPKQLWLHLDNFPEFRNISLPYTASCNRSVDEDDAEPAEWLRLALAIAVESSKGNQSKWWPWLTTVPTFKEYRSYHPILMDIGVAADFRELKFVPAMMDEQDAMNASLNCFQDVLQLTNQSLPEGVADLTHAALATAIMHLYARSYKTNRASLAMIPGADLLNTDQDQSLNTDYTTGGGVFRMVATSAVRNGRELFDLYCQKCNNIGYLEYWGVYLESPYRPIKKRGERQPRSNCSQELRQLTYDTLSANIMLPFTAAPRCRHELMSRPQGPLRCSLARLAYEGCAKYWLEL